MHTCQSADFYFCHRAFDKSSLLSVYDSTMNLIKIRFADKFGTTEP